MTEYKLTPEQIEIKARLRIASNIDLIDKIIQFEKAGMDIEAALKDTVIEAKKIQKRVASGERIDAQRELNRWIIGNRKEYFKPRKMKAA